MFWSYSKMPYLRYFLNNAIFSQIRPLLNLVLFSYVRVVILFLFYRSDLLKRFCKSKLWNFSTTLI
ncbi:hypothetical protein FF021_03025 [Leptospira noguchii]|nr:hypothetical protein FF021_03025 [Leptospira noguchii]